MAWEILESNLPQYDFVEQHQRLIPATTTDVWRAIQTAQVHGSAIARGAVALRMLPARLSGRVVSKPAPLYNLHGMKTLKLRALKPERKLMPYGQIYPMMLSVYWFTNLILMICRFFLCVYPVNGTYLVPMIYLSET